MPSNNLQVHIKVDGDISLLNKLNETLKSTTQTSDNFAKTAEKAAKSVDKVKENSESLKDTLFDLAKAAASIYLVKQAYESVVSKGFEYLTFLEQSKIGIASLIAVQLQGVNSTDKWRIAMSLAKDVIEQLEEANKKTTATLPDLINAFEASITPATRAGITLQQLVTLTQLFAQAAGAMDVPMWNLKQEITSVLMATIDYNSVIAKNLGITNEAIKQHKQLGDLYDYLLQKLQTFSLASEDIANSMAGLRSNISDVWDELTSKIVKDSGMWEVAKSALKDVYNTLQKYNEEAEKTKEISEVLKVTLKGLLYGFEGLATGLIGITEVLGAVIIGLKSIKNEAVIAFDLLVEKVLETKIKFLEFKKSLPFTDKEKLQKNIEAYRQELNKVRQDIINLSKPLEKHNSELHNFIKGLDDIRKDISDNIDKLSEKIDTKVDETSTKVKESNKEVTLNILKNYGIFAAAVKKQHEDTANLTAAQTQALLAKIDKQYRQTILGQLALLDWEEKQEIEKIKHAQLAAKQKEEYIYKIKQIYAKKRAELLQKDLKKQLKFEKSFYDEVLNTAKKSADLEYYYKVKKLNEWATEKQQTINELYKNDEQKRRYYLQLLKYSYYSQLAQLEKQYSDVVKEETKERVKYLDVFALNVSQTMQYTAQQVYRMWQTSGWAMQSVTSSLSRQAINASRAIRESYRQNVFNFISSNLRSLAVQTSQTNRGIVASFFTAADEIDKNYSDMLSHLGSVTRSFVNSINTALSNTLVNTFKGKIKTLGGFVKSFFNELKEQFIRLVAKIAAEKIILYFKNSWANDRNKDGQGFVEKLLGIDIPFLKFAHGTIWGSGRYGIVPGSARVAGDSFENDVVPALISPGEAVIPRSVVQQHRPLVEALVQKAQISDVINSVLPVKKFGFGGWVGSAVHNIVGGVGHAVSDTFKSIKETLSDFGVDINRTVVDLFTNPKNLFRDIGKTLKDLGINSLHSVGRLINDMMLRPLGLTPDDVLKWTLEALNFVNKYGWYIQLALAIMNPALIPAMLSADAMALGFAFANGGSWKEGLEQARGAGALAGIGGELAYIWQTGSVVNSNVTITDTLKQMINDLKQTSSDKLLKVKEYLKTLQDGDISKALGIDTTKEKLQAALTWLKDIKQHFSLDTILNKGSELLQHGYANVQDMLNKAVNYIATHLKDIVSHIKPSPESVSWLSSLMLKHTTAEYLGAKPLGVVGAKYQLATGGIVTKNAIVEIAENDNPEAVIPLNKLEQYLKTGKIIEKLDTLIELNENMIYLLRQLHIDNVEGV